MSTGLYTQRKGNRKKWLFRQTIKLLCIIARNNRHIHKNNVGYKFEVRMCMQSVFTVTSLTAIPGISIVAEFKIHILKYRFEKL